MSNKYFLSKYDKILKQIKEENDKLKEEKENLLKEKQILTKNNENFNLLVESLKRDADRHILYAQCCIGTIYANQHNYENAIKYYTIAASRGIKEALVRIPLLYKLKEQKEQKEQKEKEKEKEKENILKRKCETELEPIKTIDTKRVKVEDTISEISDDEDDVDKKIIKIVFDDSDDEVIVID